MTRAEEIRAHIAAHPGSTTKDIAHAIGWTVERVAASLCSEMGKGRPKVFRRVAKTSITNAPIYAYYPAGHPGEPTEKVEVSVENPAPLVENPAPLVENPAPLPKRPYVRKVKVEDVTPPKPDVSLDDLANILARAFAQQVAHKVEVHLASALQGMIATTHHAAPKLSLEDLTSRVMRVVPTVDKLPVVLIAGLLPSQAGLIVDEFHEVFDLRFFETNDNLQKLKSMLKGADHVFSFTSKSNHSVSEMMRASRPDLKVHHCMGGMTMLKQQLLQLYANGDV